MRRAFTLLELLVVIAIVLIVGTLALPALNSLNSSGSVNKAVADLSRTFELARAYAMANRTCVRVAFGTDTRSGNMVDSLVAMTMYSADGTTNGDMSQANEWPLMGKPLYLDDLKLFDSDTTFNANQPKTVNDDTPQTVNFSRGVTGGRTVNFQRVVQFNPAGEATVKNNEPSRYIKIAVDRPSPGNSNTRLNRNPFILRLSGINGSIKVLRMEDMTL